MAHIDDATLIAKTRNFARYFTEQRQVAWVALVGTILWGIIGYFKMPQRKDPDIPVVTALVITPWPGMDAERIEDRVTRRIEEVVAENKHVETVRSVSRTNVSYVYVELKEGMTETGEIFDDIGAPARPDPGPARGRRADPVHQGLRQHRGADAHGGEPAAGGGAGLAPRRPGARRDRAASARGRRRRIG